MLQSSMINDEWIEVDNNPELFPLLCNKRHEFSGIPENVRSPLEFFKLLVDDEIIDMIVINTNEYHSQELSVLSEKGKLKNRSRLCKWVPVTANEINFFFLLYCGLESIQYLI